MGPANASQRDLARLENNPSLGDASHRRSLDSVHKSRVVYLRMCVMSDFCFSCLWCGKKALLNTWALRKGGRVSAAAEGPRLTTRFSEVLEAALGVSLHGLATRLPAGGADLAVLVGELEGLDQAEGLIDVTADGQVVDGDLAESALGVDDEEATQGDTLLLNQDTVVTGNLGVLVGDQGQLEVLAEATLLAGAFAPSQVGEVAVGGDTEDGGVELLELGEGVVVGEDLGGADEGEVHGVEQENNPESASERSFAW